MDRKIECILHASNKSVVCNGKVFEIPEEQLTPDSYMFWVYLGIYVFLMLFAGMMSGLTMGLLSMDKTQLQILEKVGKPKEQKYARKIYPLIKQHHLLLVTLLLWNAAAVESMPIFMDRLTNPIVAIVISVTAVLLFGEILPQAICTRYGLAIGYYLSWFVRFLMLVLIIIAWPISKLLDCVLGSTHSTFFRRAGNRFFTRAELKELVSIHQKQEDENEEPLSIDEVLIIKGALDLRDKAAKDALVPIESVFMLSIDTRLDLNIMSQIIEAGHSRIPIYKDDRNNIVGLLLVKNAITLDPDDATPIRNVLRLSLPHVSVYEPLYNILNACQTGKSHMCVVNEIVDGRKKNVGIITLEDIIEEILQEEILDETDKYIDVAKRIKVANLKHKVTNRNRAFSGETHSLGLKPSEEENEVFETSPLLHSA